MKRREVPYDEWQFGDRSSTHVRETLLRLVLDFIRAARALPGIERITLIGSLATDKARPKDADVLVLIAEPINLASLAKLCRRFQGRAQGINSTADVFLTNIEGQYIGRVCHYRECHPRVLCRARHCGAQPHLNDDLDVVMLSPELVAVLGIIVYPIVASIGDVPADVEALLLAPLRSESEGDASHASQPPGRRRSRRDREHHSNCYCGNSRITNRGFRRRKGSISTYCARRSECPARRQAFESPGSRKYLTPLRLW